MRIWAPIPPVCLDRQRLLGEHRELHAIWVILTTNRKGYRNHPEVKRWIKYLPELAARHDQLVAELARRGYNHRSLLPSPPPPAVSPNWPPTWQPIEHMRNLLAEKIRKASS